MGAFFLCFNYCWAFLGQQFLGQAYLLSGAFSQNFRPLSFKTSGHPLENDFWATLRYFKTSFKCQIIQFFHWSRNVAERLIVFLRLFTTMRNFTFLLMTQKLRLELICLQVVPKMVWSALGGTTSPRCSVLRFQRKENNLLQPIFYLGWVLPTIAV